MFRHLPLRPLIASLALGSLAVGLTASEDSFRIAPEAFIGTAGFEIGVAAELRYGIWDPVTIRPEVTYNDDGKFGAGASVLWTVSDWFSLPDRQQVDLGPRIYWHGSEDAGWEASAMGIWSIAVGNDTFRRRHAIEVLAVLGVLQDRQDKNAELAAAAGVAYSYRF